MRTITPKALALLIIALLGGGRAAAQVVVNLNFRADNNGGNAYSGQGAYVDLPGNTFWNEITRSSVTHTGVDTTGTAFTANNFKASDGVTSSGITFSVSGAFGLYTGNDPAFATNLFNQYLVAPLYSGVASFTIGGLTPNQPYAFYFYGQSGRGDGGFRPITFTLGDGTLALTSTSHSSFVQGDNYGILQVTLSGTSVSGTFAVGSGASDGEADFNGLQIVAIPEPSAYAAISGAVALAGLGVLRWRGRRRASAFDPSRNAPEARKSRKGGNAE